MASHIRNCRNGNLLDDAMVALFCNSCYWRDAFFDGNMGR